MECPKYISQNSLPLINIRRLQLAKMDSPNKGKAKRNRGKNFESCEITLITEMFEQYKDVLKEKFNSSSNANVAVNKDKKRQIWDKITEKVNSLGVSVRSVKEVKTKWNNMHQEAKSSYTEIAMDRRRTGGGPAAKPLSATQNKIVEIFKDCPSFTGLAGVDSLTIPEGRQDDGSTQDLNCVPVMESEGLGKYLFSDNKLVIKIYLECS